MNKLVQLKNVQFTDLGYSNTYKLGVEQINRYALLDAYPYQNEESIISSFFKLF